MHLRPLGLVLSIAAFFVGGAVYAGVFGTGNMSFIAACAASWFTWHYFKKYDQGELDKRLAGKEQTWMLPYDVAYGCIKDVILRVKMSLPGSGVVSWQIAKEDDKEGTIMAMLSLQENFSQINVNFSVPLTLAVTFRLVPDGGTTRVTWTYRSFCPLGTHRVKQAIDLMDQSLDAVVAQRQFMASA